MSNQQLLRDEISRLAKIHKPVLAEHLVAAAANPKSPIHHMFEWNDTVAAHKHRLTMAKQMLRQLLNHLQYKGQAVEVRAWIPLKVDEQGNQIEGSGHYVPFEKLTFATGQKAYMTQQLSMAAKNVVRAAAAAYTWDLGIDKRMSKILKEIAGAQDYVDVQYS